TDQAQQVESLKSALMRLQTKLAETESQAEILVSRHRRSLMMQRASEARWKAGDLDKGKGGPLDRAGAKVCVGEMMGVASYEVTEPDVNDRVARLERREKIEEMLAELKAKRESK